MGYEGCNVEAVLGCATTRTTVGFVLVEGLRADGATIHSDAFQVHTRGGFTAFDACEQEDAYEQLANRVWLQMRTIAAAHRVRFVGATWSHDADREAKLLRDSLTDAGLDNVVAVGLPDAGNALATAVGYEKTAVCVIEPQMTTAFVVDLHGQKKIVRHAGGDGDGHIRWLTEILDGDDWHAEGLVVAGSDRDRDAVTSQLAQALPVPVVAPARAQLALALGAALAAAHDTESTDAEAAPKAGGHDFRHRPRWPVSHPRAMLLTGLLALMVLLSLGLGPPLISDKPPAATDHPQVANTSGRSPAVHPVAPPVPTPVQHIQPPPADTPLAPAPQITPPVAVDVSPPASAVPEPPVRLPTVVPDGPAPQQPGTPPPPELNQPPPPIPDPPSDGQAPPRPNCFLLCGTAI